MRLSWMMVILLVVCVSVDARAETVYPKNHRSEIADSEATSTEHIQSPWQAWGLTESDWQRYQDLMQGPRGLWTPNISPISALGLNATSEAERRRYAILAAELDWQRMTRERAWHLAYKDAQSDVFGERLANLNLPAESYTLAEIPPNSRLVLFTNAVACPALCRETLDHVISSSAVLDIYFVDGTDKAGITQWASSSRIPAALVNDQGRITLNRDNGFFAAMSPDSQRLPQVYLRDASRQDQLVEVML